MSCWYVVILSYVKLLMFRDDLIGNIWTFTAGNRLDLESHRIQVSIKWLEGGWHVTARINIISTFRLIFVFIERLQMSSNIIFLFEICPVTPILIYQVSNDQKESASSVLLVVMVFFQAYYIQHEYSHLHVQFSNNDKPFLL